jgi:hypothetical protein
MNPVVVLITVNNWVDDIDARWVIEAIEKYLNNLGLADIEIEVKFGDFWTEPLEALPFRPPPVIPEELSEASFRAETARRQAQQLRDRIQRNLNWNEIEIEIGSSTMLDIYCQHRPAKLEALSEVPAGASTLKETAKSQGQRICKRIRRNLNENDIGVEEDLAALSLHTLPSEHRPADLEAPSEVPAEAFARDREEAAKEQAQRVCERTQRNPKESEIGVKEDDLTALPLQTLPCEHPPRNLETPSKVLDEIAAREEAAKSQAQRILDRFEQHLKKNLIPDWE